MTFLVDQPISWEVAVALQQHGHQAAHVGDLGLSAAGDEIILARAAADQAVVVTQDTDFGTLLATNSSQFPSVILFRLHDGRPPTQARLLLQNLERLAGDLERGAIVVIGDSGIRVRRLPI